MELLRQCVHWHASARFSREHLSRTASEYRAGHAGPLARVNRRGPRSADISTRGFANRRNGLIVIYSSLELCMNVRALVCAAVGIAMGSLTDAYAEQPPPPCHPNPNAAADRDAVANRGDVVKLPQALKDRLIR